ncbi:unnamed protein product [Didymodactylos carnosus]|uniref:Tetraspanin n=1 Tax=Didymodactylos carnosus TaxID=1234261 RepID=A0A815SW35_9BILA|nr:unnamed protein product [Didymodactylos carnosus]CAF1497094.1 unnamed protein product [Didymodactylos carnosus]CAF3991804.1 unnamed protein product [Didymodactylos carnosus]CAF4359377.1 unnamed protein product [Didymodactylos carnosus]
MFGKYNRQFVSYAKIVAVIALSVIHLGVAAGIIAKVQQYGDFFQQQLGLCGFNIVISLLGLLVGGFGAFAVFTKRGVLAKIVAGASFVLVLFALASLIAALVINGNSIGELDDSFNNYMVGIVVSYKTLVFISLLDNARTVMDRVQSQYQCCGEFIWTDWYFFLQRTSIATGSNNNNDNSGQNGGPVGPGRRRRTPLAHGIHKRQSNYGNIENWIGSYTIDLPASCCTTTSSVPSGLGTGCQLTSSSNTDFNTNGCLYKLASLAAQETMGIGIINCFLIVVALFAISSLYEIFPDHFAKNEMKKIDYNDGTIHEYGINYSNGWPQNAYANNGYYTPKDPYSFVQRY